ncbi:MAG: AMP-binding protein, partial [Alphaproteobacteria bacterium]
MTKTDRAKATRAAWLELLKTHRRDFAEPGSADYWSPSLECASRDELRAIQDEKLKVLTPFLYENSPFYKRRFDRLGLTPDDVNTVDKLTAWPVVDKMEMAEDLMANPPWGTYTTHDDALWDKRGWTLFPTSGSTGMPRIFRYTTFDLDQWRWANARALWSLGAKRGEKVFLVVGFGPHVWAWGVLHALAHMGVPCIPGGGLTAELRANIILRYKPTVLATLPSQLLRIGRTMQAMGEDPRKSSITRLFTGGEPAGGIDATRERLEDMWDAELVEFYGCTEASPHSGGYSCTHRIREDGAWQTHLMEDFQVWELIDPDSKERLPIGERGITVCT